MASLASIRLRGVVMAPTGRRHTYVTSRQYGRRAIYVSGDVRFQDGDIVDLKEIGVPLSSVLYFFPPKSELALANLSLSYTYRSTVV